MLYLVILSIIQGITEFLPISSSAHTMLFDHFTKNPNSSIDITIALHLGSLIALIIYYKKDVITIWHEKFSSGKKEKDNILLKLIIAFIPTMIVGGVLFLLYPKFLTQPIVIATTSFIFAILLWYYDKMPQKKTVDDLRKRDAFMIGLFQLLSFIPGVSRSGITITAGRKIGMHREEAVKFSMLLAVLTISAVSAVSFIKVLSGDNFEISSTFLVGAVLSFIFSYFSLIYFVKYIKKVSFNVFVIYRIALSIVLFYLIFTGIIK